MRAHHEPLTPQHHDPICDLTAGRLGRSMRAATASVSHLIRRITVDEAERTITGERAHRSSAVRICAIALIDGREDAASYRQATYRHATDEAHQVVLTLGPSLVDLVDGPVPRIAAPNDWWWRQHASRGMVAPPARRRST